MSLSLYEASVPGMLRSLRALSGFLDKAEAHALETGADLAAYSDARLAPDMAPFNRQIHMASDGAKSAVARLAGVEAPAFPDVEVSFPDLKARIAKTIAYLETFKPEQIDGDAERIIEIKLPSRTLTFTARDFLFNFALSNFMFHVTTAYALLRAQGVPLGKADFLAGAI